MKTHILTPWGQIIRRDVLDIVTIKETPVKESEYGELLPPDETYTVFNLVADRVGKADTVISPDRDTYEEAELDLHDIFNLLTTEQ